MYLESLSLEGNPFREDENKIRNFVQSFLKSVKILNGIRLERIQDFNSNNSPGKAKAGISNGSQQNYPDLLKELSTFSQTMKPNPSNNSGGVFIQPQSNHLKYTTSSLINAKIGKNRSRRDSTEGISQQQQQFGVLKTEGEQRPGLVVGRENQEM
jgi:hypothetical protein